MSHQSNQYHFSAVPREKLQDPREARTTGVYNQSRGRVKVLYIRSKSDHHSGVDIFSPSLSSNLPSPGEQFLSTLTVYCWWDYQMAWYWGSYASLAQPDWFRYGTWHKPGQLESPLGFFSTEPSLLGHYTGIMSIGGSWGLCSPPRRERPSLVGGNKANTQKVKVPRDRIWKQASRWTCLRLWI